MGKLRWNPYLLSSTEKAVQLLNTHFGDEKPRKVLLIMAKGFDIRMNFVLKQLLDLEKPIDLSCKLICFDEGSGSTSHQYKKYVDENFLELEKLLDSSKIELAPIKLWKEEGNRKRRIGDREASGIIKSFDDIKDYTDIIVDISALPRGIYFSLTGKILTLIDNKPEESPLINLMVMVAENAALDACIKEQGLDQESKPLMGFMGGIKSKNEREEPLIWLPILGEDKKRHIEKTNDDLEPDEVCPLFPFPAKDPRRPDSLLINYHDLLLDKLNIEPQNIMYVPEQNPFEAYKIIVNTIKNYTKSMSVLNKCRAALSTFSSKLLSIGTLLAAYEINNSEGQKIVGVVNIDSQGYTLENEESFDELNKSSELFVIWLTGDPYEK